MVIKTGATYDFMPPLSGAVRFEEYENPGENKARLTIRDANTKLFWEFGFVGGRAKDSWQRGGMAPVVWHYVPPTRDRPPQVWVAVDRLTTIKETPPKGEWCWFWMKKRPEDMPPKEFQSADMGRGGAGCGCHTGHHVRTPKLEYTGSDYLRKSREYDRVDLKPKVTILRVQNPSLMPDPLDPTTIMSCIGEPHILLSGGNAEALEKDDYGESGELSFEKITKDKDRVEIVTGLLILPQPQGVVFQALNNWFYLTIELKDPNKPGCFAYKAMTARSVKVFLIEHDSNVRIEVTTIEAPSVKPIIVYARQWSNSGNVPVQGAAIKFVKDRFRRIEVPDTSKTSLVLATQLVVETLMGFVPVIGDLYQFGQLAYMCATGEDFWGHKVSSSDIVLYGVLSVVGTGAPALMKRAAKLKALKNWESLAGAIESPNGMAAAIIRETDEIVAKVGGNATARELSVVGQAQREKILEPVIDAVVSGGDAVKSSEKAGELLKEGIEAAIKADPKVKDAIEDIRAAAMVTGDGANFQNQYIRFEYDLYLAKGGKDGPLRWLASSSRNPWVDKYCKTLFGGDYKKVIRGSHARNGVPGAMNMAHINLYDKLIGKGIGNYGQMGRQSRGVKGAEKFGQFFELDHLIEQRFLKRFTDYTDAYTKGQAFGTFLVPRNAAVAAEMVKVAKDSKLITYVHVVKTRMLSQRIPFGAEKLFDVQQITDATLYTLHKLGAGSYLDIKFLETDFKLLAQAMKQEMPILKTAAELTDDLFTAAKGWPQIKCDNWGRAIF